MVSVGKISFDSSIDLSGFQRDRATLLKSMGQLGVDGADSFKKSFNLGNLGLGAIVRKDLTSGINGLGSQVSAALKKGADEKIAVGLDTASITATVRAAIRAGGDKAAIQAALKSAAAAAAESAAIDAAVKSTIAAGGDAAAIAAASAKAVKELRDKAPRDPISLAVAVPDIGKTITDSILRANFATFLTNTILDGVQGSIGGVISKLQGAFNAVTGDLGAGIRGTIAENSIAAQLSRAPQVEGEKLGIQASLASMGGVEWNQAGEAAAKVRAALGKAAAVQAGENADYQELLAGLQGYLIKGTLGKKKSLDASDLQKLQDNSIAITQNLGNFAATSGRGKASWNSAQMGVAALMSGDSMAQLENLDFFQKDAREFLPYVKKVLAAVGAQKFTDLDRGDQIQLLREASQQGLTAERAKASGNTMDSIVQGAKSQLFDADSGTFSIMRDLGGGASVFESIKNTIKETINFFNELGKAGGAAGVSLGDPMKFLNEIIIGINVSIQNASLGLGAFFASTSGQALVATFAAIGEHLSKIPEMLMQAFGMIGPLVGPIIGLLAPIGTMIAPFLPLVAIVAGLGPIVAGIAGSLAAAAVPALAIGGAFTLLGPALAGVGAAVDELAGKLSGLFDGLLSTIGPVITESIAKISEIIPPIIENVMQGVTAIAPLVIGLVEVVMNFLPPVVSFLGAVFEAVTNIVAGVLGGLAPFLPVVVDAIGGVLASVGDLLGLLGGVIKFLGDQAWLWDAIGKLVGIVLVGAINSVRLLIDAVINGVKAIGDLWQAVGTLIKWGWDLLKGLLSTLNPVDSTTGKVKDSWGLIGQAMQKAWDLSKGFLGTIVDMAKSFGGFLKMIGDAILDMSGLGDQIRGIMGMFGGGGGGSVQQAGGASSTIAGVSMPPEIAAFIEMFRVGEGTTGDKGFTTMFTGKQFSGFADHPRQLQSGGGFTSDAAGMGQFLSTTWDGVAKQIGAKDFSPENQVKGIIQLIKNRGAYDDLLKGDLDAALSKTSYEWASLPSGTGAMAGRYGQPAKTGAEAQRIYNEKLAEIRGSSASSGIGGAIGAIGNMVAGVSSSTGSAGSSPLGMASSKNAGKVIVNRTGQKDENGLEILSVQTFDQSGRPIAQLTANSGIRSTQGNFGQQARDVARTNNPLPFGDYAIGDTVQAPPNPGYGKLTTIMTPQFSTARAGIEAHVDGNRTTSPGSAGCLVFKSEAEFAAFMTSIRQSGAKTIRFEEATLGMASSIASKMGSASAPPPKTPVVIPSQARSSIANYKPTEVAGPEINIQKPDDSPAAFQERFKLNNTLEKEAQEAATKNAAQKDKRFKEDNELKVRREREKREFDKRQSELYRLTDAPIKAAQQMEFDRKTSLYQYDDKEREYTRMIEDFEAAKKKKEGQLKALKDQLELGEKGGEKGVVIDLKELATGKKYEKQRIEEKIDLTDYSARIAQIAKMRDELKADRKLTEETQANKAKGLIYTQGQTIDAEIASAASLKQSSGQNSDLEKYFAARTKIIKDYAEQSKKLSAEIAAMEALIAGGGLDPKMKDESLARVAAAKKVLAANEADQKTALERAEREYTNNQERGIRSLLKETKSIASGETGSSVQSKYDQAQLEKAGRFSDQSQKIDDQLRNLQESLKAEGASAEQKKFLKSAIEQLTKAQKEMNAAQELGIEVDKRQLALDQEKEAVALRTQALKPRIELIKGEAANLQKYNAPLANDLNRRAALIELAQRQSDELIKIEETRNARMKMLATEDGKRVLERSGIGASKEAIDAQAQVERAQSNQVGERAAQDIQSKFPTIAGELREKARNAFSDGLKGGLHDLVDGKKFDFGAILKNITKVFLDKGIDMITQNVTNGLFGGSDKDKGALGAMEASSTLDEGTRRAGDNIINAAMRAAEIIGGATPGVANNIVPIDRGLGGLGAFDGKTSPLQTNFGIGMPPSAFDTGGGGIPGQTFSIGSALGLNFGTQSPLAPLSGTQPLNTAGFGGGAAPSFDLAGAAKIGTDLGLNFATAAEETKLGENLGGNFAGTAAQGLGGLLNSISGLFGGSGGGKKGVNIGGLLQTGMQIFSAFSGGGAAPKTLASGGSVDRADFSALRKMPGAIGDALRREGPDSVLIAATPGERMLSLAQTAEFHSLGGLPGMRAALMPPAARDMAAIGGISGFVANHADGGIIGGEAGGQLSFPVPTSQSIQANNAQTFKFEYKSIGQENVVTVDQLAAAEARLNRANNPQIAVDMMQMGLRNSIGFRRSAGL